MFGIFKRKSPKTSSRKSMGEKTISGSFAFNNKMNLVVDTDTLDSASLYSSGGFYYNGNVSPHGRIAEMLDEDDMAWTKPRGKSNRFSSLFP